MAVRAIRRQAWARRRGSQGRRPALEALESRQLLAASISEYPTETVGGNPSSIVSGADGNLWFTNPQFQELGSINSTTKAFQLFPTPGVTPRTIASGPDGSLWFTAQVDSSTGFVEGQIGEINLSTHSIQEFPIPGSTFPTGITAGPDGNLWFGEEDITSGMIVNAIGEFNPSTHTFAEYAITSPTAPQNITTGPDGNLWFTTSGPMVWTINPTSHAVSQYAVPTAYAGITGIAAGPDGNIWFTETDANRIGEISLVTHAVNEFFLPQPNSYPQGITAGPGGDLWFTDGGAGLRSQGGVSAIGTINPRTHAIAVAPTPSINSFPSGITTGPDGHVWFVETSADQVGVVNSPGLADGPRVVSVARHGVHYAPTSLVLTFNEPLDASSAQNPANYLLVGPAGQPIAVRSATYNPFADTVTLAPASRLNLLRNYYLTVIGTAPSGVADINGNLLDGAGNGQAGSNFVTIVGRWNLALARSSRAAPKLQHEALLQVRAAAHRRG